MKMIILAGGSGKRLASGKNSLPKPLADIGGKPLLWHIMKYFSCLGINGFVVCLGYKGSLIRKHMSECHEISCGSWDVRFIDTGLDSTKLLRIEMAAKYADPGTNLLSYSDNLCDLDLGAFLLSHNVSGMMLSLAGVKPYSPYGHIFRDDGILTFKEKPRMMNSLINAGFMAFEKEFIEYISRFSGELETDVISSLAQEGRLNVFEHNGNWDGINTLKEYEAVCRLHQQGKAYWEIWKK
ncbi:MAG: sugar phosphate nucleotidyltransferase [Clostridia bacterium]